MYKVFLKYTTYVLVLVIISNVVRLVEFEETASGNLTIEQFNTIDLEEEADPPCFTQSRREAKLKQVSL